MTDTITITETDRERLKRAVKEALDDKAIEDLGKQLTALSSQMTEGFSRVETRQDIANGKLMKHEVKIDDIMERAKQEASRTKNFTFILEHP